MEIFLIPIVLGILLGVGISALILLLVWGLAVHTARLHMTEEHIE